MEINIATQVGLFIGIAALVYITFYLTNSRVLKVLKEMSKKTKNNFDDIAVSAIETLPSSFYVLLALYISSQFVQIPEQFVSILDRVFFLWLVYIIVSVSGSMVDFVVKNVVKKLSSDSPEESQTIELASGTLSSLIKGAVWVMAALLVLQNFGVNITSIIAGLGVGGIAIAFALQKILVDLFSAIVIIFDKPFKVGDFVTIDSIQGTVLRIGIKTTRIRQTNGEEIIMPNERLTTSNIINSSRKEERRISFVLGVEYNTKSEKLKKIPGIISSCLKDLKNVKEDRVYLINLAASAIEYEVVYYVTCPDVKEWKEAHQQLNYNILEKLEAEGIDIAYPSQTVFLKKES